MPDAIAEFVARVPDGTDDQRAQLRQQMAASYLLARQVGRMGAMLFGQQLVAMYHQLPQG
jgi:hypothetical protein